MNTRRTEHIIQGIVPPHILEAITRSGDAKDREVALRSLSEDQSIRTQRIVKSLQTPPAGSRAFTAGAGAGPHKQRTIDTCKNTTTLPGTPVRSEGQAPSGDAAVDEAYNGLGATYDLYWNVFKRDSIDNAGMGLIGSVHYGSNYDNAEWNGSLMLFGDGDGKYFNRFTISIDIMGHELTHGVTAHEANLTYSNQSGALNESVSDCFGSMVKQYAHNPQQTSAQADWLIGAGLFTANVNGVALRSMKAPGTAYDDKVLGKDPQPGNMSGYVNTTGDNGGVHTNSGIPNHAFYLAAVALGGYSWEKAGPIWYATLCDKRLSANAQFQDFANLTTDNAGKLFGQTEKDAVRNAWIQVGITPVDMTPVKITGNWVLHFSWGATGNYSQTNLTFNNDGTFTGGASGKWTQQNGTLLWDFTTGPAVYAGNLDGNVGAGSMSTFAGLDGCWYLVKQGTVGLESHSKGTGEAQKFDVAGKPTGVEAELAGVGPDGRGAS